MMRKIFKIFSILVVLITLILVIGRNHFLLGTIFITTKWFLLLLLLLLSFISHKKKYKQQFKFLILACIFILVESSYVFIKSNRLELTYSPKKNTYLNIINYNLYFKNANKKSTLNIVKNKDVDLYCFQEVTPNWETFIRKNLNYKYKISKALKGTHGISVFSKYPIKLIKYLRNSNNLPYAQFFEITKDKKKVLVCHVHLSSPAIAVENPEHFLKYFSQNYSRRCKQYKTINEYLKSMNNKYPIIIMIGDFNTTEYEPLFRDINYDWINFSKSSILKNSFPNSSKTPPLFDLDYLFMNKNLKVEFKMLKGGNSDHLPFKAKIRF